MVERQAFGIDVNEYSRTCGISYDLVKANLASGGYDFIIIKAGQGLYPSRLLVEQRMNAELNNIPYATYHFIDPRCGMLEQARKYVDWVGTEQKFYVVDIESPQAGVRFPTKNEILTFVQELENLTHQQPVLYSSRSILSSIGFIHEASQFRLWIAQYPYDATRPSQNAQYRYFSDFVKKYAQRTPVTVTGTELEQSTILWQFSSKGDGPYYIYNATTADPMYNIGMKDADMNASIKSCSAFMKEMFNIDKVGGEGVYHPVVEAPYPGMNNQKMINLIYQAAASFNNDGWNDWIVRAGLESLAIPSSNRNRTYMGPKVEDMPNLKDEEKAALLQLMAG